MKLKINIRKISCHKYADNEKVIRGAALKLLWDRRCFTYWSLKVFYFPSKWLNVKRLSHFLVRNFSRFHRNSWNNLLIMHETWSRLNFFSHISAIIICIKYVCMYTFSLMILILLLFYVVLYYTVRAILCVSYISVFCCS